MPKSTQLLAVFIFCATFPFSSIAAAQDLESSINQPTTDTKVGRIEFCKGKISGGVNHNLYVLVSPISSGIWWVQRHPSVNNNAWWTTCIFGKNDNELNKFFQIMTMITQKTLKTGQVLKSGDFPKDAITFSPILVNRTH